MEYFLTYLKVFAVGGLICVIGQVLINKTQMSSARILVSFMLAGVVLELCGVFAPIEEFAKAGVTVPIVGFGSGLAKGALKGAAENGILGALKGGMAQVSAGLSAVILFGFVFALLSKSRSKTI